MAGNYSRNRSTCVARIPCFICTGKNRWVLGMEGSRERGPRLTHRSSLPAENFLQQAGCSSHWIFANILFFLGKCVEQAIERLGNDIFGDIEVLTFEKWNGFGLSDQGIVLLGYLVLAHALLNDRAECRHQLCARLALEIVRGGRISSREDLAGVVKAHG